MAMRDWRWPQWLILISLIVLLLLGAVVLYVLLTPDALRRPVEPLEPEVPISGLPPEELGRPEFPPSEIEKIPFGEIQGTDIVPAFDSIALGDVTTVSDLSYSPVTNVGAGPSGNSLNFYDPDQKLFFRVNSDGTTTQLGTRVFAEVEGVTWADNGNDAIIEFPDGSNIVYNFDTDEQITLPAHWEDFAFSPSSEEIIFKSIALDPSENWLAVASKSGSSARKIQHLGDNHDIVDVDWSPNNQVVATYNEPSGLSTSETFFLGLNHENFPLSKIHGLNFESTWTPDGQDLLYSASHSDNDFKPRLWFVDGSGGSLGQNRKQISLDTWSHKCSFSNDNYAYCGVPSKLPRGAGLIPSLADNIADNIYRIDLSTGQSNIIAIPSDALNVKSMNVSGDGTELFIHDGLSGRLKKVQLP